MANGGTANDEMTDPEIKCDGILRKCSTCFGVAKINERENQNERLESRSDSIEWPSPNAKPTTDENETLNSKSKLMRIVVSAKLPDSTQASKSGNELRPRAQTQSL